MTVLRAARTHAFWLWLTRIRACGWGSRTRTYSLGIQSPLRHQLRHSPMMSVMNLAGDQGFEPRIAESESAVIPFHQSPICPGGRGGIRTHGTLARSAVFKTAGINHSPTLPCSLLYGAPQRIQTSNLRFRRPAIYSVDLAMLTWCPRRDLNPQHSDFESDASANWTTRARWSGRRDSNSRPLVPQTSALTRLSHAPISMSTSAVSLRR